METYKCQKDISIKVSSILTLAQMPTEVTYTQQASDTNWQYELSLYTECYQKPLKGQATLKLLPIFMHVPLEAAWLLSVSVKVVLYLLSVRKTLDAEKDLFR